VRGALDASTYGVRGTGYGQNLLVGDDGLLLALRASFARISLYLSSAPSAAFLVFASRRLMLAILALRPT
jgi:hypothetical protein